MSKIKLLENTDDAGIFEQLLSGFQAATKDLKPGEKFHFVVERENDEATAARLDEIATEEANDAETVAEAKELAGKLRRGRRTLELRLALQEEDAFCEDGGAEETE